MRCLRLTVLADADGRNRAVFSKRVACKRTRLYFTAGNSVNWSGGCVGQVSEADSAGVGENTVFHHLRYCVSASLGSMVSRLPGWCSESGRGGARAAGDLLVTKKNKTSSRLQNRKISADGCLGITLMWLSSTCETKYLGVIFGVNEHLAWKYIRLGCGLLFLVSSEKSQRVCLKSTHTSPDPTTRCDLPLGCLS